MTTMEVVVIAAAIIAALVVLVKIWIHIIIPTWEALVRLWDKTVVAWEKTVDVYDVVADFVRDYIIWPVKLAVKKVRRFFMTPLERAKAERDDMAKSAESLEKIAAMGMLSDESMIDTLWGAVEAYDEMIADKEARMAAEAEAKA